MKIEYMARKQHKLQFDPQITSTPNRRLLKNVFSCIPREHINSGNNSLLIAIQVFFYALLYDTKLITFYAIVKNVERFFFRF